MSLYYFTNYLLVLAILVLLYIPNSPKVIITASTITTSIAFGGILSLSLYYFYCNLSSKYITK